MIKNLVPDIELCQRAKELGWERPTCYYHTRFNSTDEWELCFNMDDKMRSDVYAPTLQEVLEELPVCRFDSCPLSDFLTNGG